MKRVLLVLGALVLLGAGAAAVFAFSRWRASQDIRGSSTVEFDTSEHVARRPPRDPIRWATYGFDNQRLRVDSEDRLAPPYRSLWVYRAHSLLEFPPVLGYQRLFVETNNGRLLALESRRGTVVWSHATGRCAAASPTIDAFTVFAVFLNAPPCNAKSDNLNGKIFAFRTRDGQERWHVTIGPSETSPLVEDGRIYVGDWNGKIHALDEQTGRMLWTYETGGAVKGALAYADGRVFAGSYDHHVYCLDARTGKLVWRASAQQRLGPQGTFYSTPAVAYGRVYIGSTDGKVYSFGEESGKLRWSQSTGDYVYSSPAVWHKLVLIGSHDKHLYALDAATGDVVWKVAAGGRISGSPTVINDVVYVSTLAQKTLALDARTGARLWSWNDGKYAGAIGGRLRLYLTGYTRIYALLPRPPG